MRSLRRYACSIKRVAAVSNVDRTQLSRFLHQPPIQIDADHVTTGRPENLTRELSDQPQPDHRNPLPNSRVGLAHAMHGDTCHGGERSGVEINRVRQPDAQISRNRDYIRVSCVLSAPTRDAKSGHKPTDPGADRHYDAGR